MPNNKQNLLIYSSSDAASGTDIFYATGFAAPDPFIFLRLRGSNIIIVSELELGRAKKEAKVDKVLCRESIVLKLKKSCHPDKKIETVDIIFNILNREKIKEVVVPDNFPVGLADKIRERGIIVFPKKNPFFESRAIKSYDEVKKIQNTQKALELAMDSAINILRKAKIEGNKIYYNKKPLTSEYIRQLINCELIRNNCIVNSPIVACGNQGCFPHSVGKGFIFPHKPIIIDLFARSCDSGYWADMTRTVVKGKPSLRLKKMYDAVLEAQKKAFEIIRNNADGKEIHIQVKNVFEKLGYKTRYKKGEMEGFFHGTGHGVGLDIHEFPFISPNGNILKQGNVVTVEPGLYYLGIGGVRIEDMVVVENDGCYNLTKYPKFLELQ